MRHAVRTILLGLLPLVALATAVSSNAAPVGVPTPVAGSGVHKLDAVLRAQTLRTVRDNPSVDLFVKSTDPLRTRAEILRLGGTVNTVSGRVLTARMPQNAITKLSDGPQVERLEAAGRVRARMDKALEETKADKVHDPGVGGKAYKGKGVVVGIVDFGFDLTHTAFKTAAGASRAVAVWDQAATGTPPTGYNYGTECNAAAIMAGNCTVTAAGNHGVHVTGIAAGSPVAGSVPAYSGMAPESDIVFVHTTGAGTAICDAADYIFKLAQAAGKPAVVNMSLGGHDGPHDGTALEDECLDNLTGPGKIIVAAAGNEGEGSTSPKAGAPKVSVHAQLVGAAGGTQVRFLPSTNNNAISENVSVWFDAPSDISLRVGAVDAAGTTTFSSVATIAAPVAAATLTVGSRTVGPVTIGAASFPSGARQFSVTIEDANNDKQELDDVTWILEATGTGKVDAYIDTTNTGGFLTPSPAVAGVTVDSDQTIGNPGIAKNVIAVGSFVTRNTWMPADATLGVQSNNNVLGALSGFSSHGPPRRATAVTGPKPDITAPGDLILSALHADVANEAPERIMKAKPNGYVLSEGTSMASPAVAGIVALMLEAKPTLTVAQIRDALAATATVPAGGEAKLWGRGKINALAAVQQVLGTPADAGVDSGSTTSSSSSSSSSSSGSTTSSSSSGEPSASSSSGEEPPASSSSSSTSGVPATSTSSTASSSGTTDNAAAPAEDSGCSTARASTDSFVVPAGLAALGIALVFARRSRKRG